MDFLRKVVLLLLVSTAVHAQQYPVITAGGGIQEWQTATNYVIDDIVWEAEDFYKALTIHTSGVFATDLANAEWVRMSDDLDKIGASTDNGLVRWDGVLGEAVQDSSVTLLDTGDMAGVASLHIGAATSTSASMVLDVTSTTRGTRPWSSMSTAQRDAIVAPASGLSIYNTDTNRVNVFDGTTWGAVGAGIDAWQAAFEYKTGDVVYDGTDSRNEIYRANSDFTSGGAFVPGNWTELAQHIDALPASVDETLLRWDGVTGDLIQATGVVINDSNNVSGVGTLSMGETITYGNTDFNLVSNTIDGSDNRVTNLNGGGAAGSGRGATLSLFGNEAVTGGSVEFSLGVLGSADFKINDSSGDLAFNIDTVGVASLPLLTPSKPLLLNASNEIVAGDVDASDITGVLPVVNGGTGNAGPLTGNLVMVSNAAGTSISESPTLSYDGNIFEVSTPDGSIPMTKMNQASRLALTPVNGTTVYDTDDETPYFWDGTAWKKFGGSEISSSTLSVDDYDELTFPLSQATIVSSSPTKVLRLETGNDSFLANGSFEHEIYDSSWVTSGSATFALESSDIWEGSKAISIITSGSQTGILEQSTTLTQYENNVVGFTCMVKSDSAKVKLCTENGSDEKDCAFHDGQGTWKPLQAIMTVDSTGVMKGSVKNIDSEDASFIVDSCEWSSKSLNLKAGYKEANIYVDGYDSFSGGFIKFKTVRQNNSNDLLTLDNSGTRTEFIAAQSGTATITMSAEVGSGTNVFIEVYNSSNTLLVRSGDLVTGAADELSASLTYKMDVGDYAVVSSGTSFVDSQNDHFSIKMTQENEEIITSSDVVSSETLAFQFKGSGTGALDCLTDSVGTYTTFSKAASTNAVVQCASAPTIPPTNLDGFFLDPAGFQEVGNCTNQVGRFQVCIGKGLKGYEVEGYQLAAKAGVTLSTADYQYTGGSGRGLDTSYNSTTGTFTIDSYVSHNSAEVSRFFTGVDAADYNGGYFHFHASKNPVVNSVQTIPIVNYSWENHFGAKIEGSQNTLVGNPVTVLSQGEVFIASVTHAANTAEWDIVYTAGKFTVAPAITCTGVSSTGTSAASDRTCAVVSESAAGATVRLINSGGTFIDDDFFFKVTRQDSDHKKLGSTAAVIAQPTCILKDIKAGSAGGSSLNSGISTRDLNTLEGDCTGISLAANVITVNPGGDATYIIRGSAPAFASNGHQAYLQNTSDAVREIMGTAQNSDSGNNGDSRSYIRGSITVPAGGKNYEVQHWTQTAKASNGLGVDVGTTSGLTDNVFTEIEFTRIK